MTNDEKQRIINDEVQFRLHVVEELSEIKANRVADKEDICELKAVVYGPNGRDGLNGQVITLKETTARWNKGLAVIQALLAVLIGYLGVKIK